MVPLLADVTEVDLAMASAPVTEVTEARTFGASHFLTNDIHNCIVVSERGIACVYPEGGGAT